MWRRILDSRAKDETKQRIGTQIETEFILPNHQEVVRLLETKIHLAAGDQELITALLKYIRHVAVYSALRSAGIGGIDPIHLNEPWPEEVFPLVENRTLELQAEYDRILTNAASDT